MIQRVFQVTSKKSQLILKSLIYTWTIIIITFIRRDLLGSTSDGAPLPKSDEVNLVTP